MIGSFPDDANVLFRARGAGAIIVPRPASQMSDRAIDEEGLAGCFASFSLGVPDNKADGIKNGCLRDLNESPISLGSIRSNGERCSDKHLPLTTCNC